VSPRKSQVNFLKYTLVKLSNAVSLQKENNLMNKKSQETPKYLEINDNFQRNIQALYVFNKVIGSFADEHDKTIHKSFEENLKKLLFPIKQETNKDKKYNVPLCQDQYQILFYSTSYATPNNILLAS
jgi:hypothetical protein